MARDRIRILCVDDNPLITESLRVRLDREPGFELVGRLGTANDLVEEVARHRPDIVLLDIDMPGRDAFDALGEVHGVSPQSKVIILSGHVRDDLVDRAVEAGAWGYISKGDDSKTMLDTIRAVHGGRFVLSPDVQGLPSSAAVKP